MFHLLIVVLPSTESDFSCFAVLAKRNPVSGPTYLPLIPNQLHCILTCAHGVLETTLEVGLMPVFTFKINGFVLA